MVFEPDPSDLLFILIIFIVVYMGSFLIPLIRLLRKNDSIKIIQVKNKGKVKYRILKKILWFWSISLYKNELDFYTCLEFDSLDETVTFCQKILK